MNQVKAPSKADIKEAKRQELVARVKEAEARLDARGSRVRANFYKARENTSVFVTRHPLSSLTGGILLGVVVGRLIPRPRPTPSAARLARVTAETGRAYLAEARKQAKQSIKASRKAAKELEHRAEEFGEVAEERAEDALDDARSFTRAAAQSALEVIRALRDRRS